MRSSWPRPPWRWPRASPACRPAGASPAGSWPTRRPICRACMPMCWPPHRAGARSCCPPWSRPWPRHRCWSCRRAWLPFFEDAAVYLASGESLVDRLGSLQPAAARACRRAAAALHRSVTGPEAMAKRLRAQLGPPPAAAPRLELRREARAPRNVLFLTPNGVGMGHLTRLLAIARHSPGTIRPIFLSMSQAVGVVERFGYIAEYFPYHTHTGETAEAWSQALRARLNEAIAFYDARCVVFDGNVPYQGLIEARQDNANRPFVWIRRGMWRPEAGRATIDRGRHFDLVIEPGEFACRGRSRHHRRPRRRGAAGGTDHPVRAGRAARPRRGPRRARPRPGPGGGDRAARCAQQFRLPAGRPGRPRDRWAPGPTCSWCSSTG